MVKYVYAYTIFLLLVLSGSASRAQNLVPNPSFEQYSACPQTTGNTSFPSQANPFVPGWYGANNGSPDHYHSCSVDMGVPLNWSDYQPAHTGNGYAGIHVFTRLTGDAYTPPPEVKEYMQTRLTAPMIAGHRYLVQFYVSLSGMFPYNNLFPSNTVWACDQIGARFSPTVIEDTTTVSLYPYMADLDYLQKGITSPAGAFFTDSTGWTKVEGIYTAAGGEEWMVLGNFVPHQQVVTQLLEQAPFEYMQAGYYFFDDVCVTDITSHTATTRTRVCDAVAEPLQGRAGMSAYRWSTGATTPSITATAPGTYWVESTGDCDAWADTFIITRPSLAVSLGPDTEACAAFTLRPAVTAGAALRWQDGSANGSFPVAASGTYWVTATLDGCSRTDTVHVSIPDLRQDLGPDQYVCKGSPVQLPLQAQVPAGAAVRWSTGSTAPQIQATDTGAFWVEVYTAHCAAADTMRIGEALCECFVNVPTAFSPNNDGHNDFFRPVIERGCPMGGFRLNIYNRWGQLVHSSYAADKGWDGSFNDRQAEAGTYMYELRFEGGTLKKAYYRKGDFLLIR